MSARKAVRFKDGLAPNWEAVLTPRLIGWRVAGWYSGPEVEAPEEILLGFCWTERSAREQIVYWIEDTEKAPREEWACPEPQSDAGLIDLAVILLAAGLLAAIAGGLGIWAGAGVAGLLLAAAAPVLIVAAIAVTVSGDRRRNRFAAASWDSAVALVPAEAAEPAPAVSEDQAAAFAVSASGEAERLADAGNAVIGLVAGIAAITVPIAATVAVLFPQLTQQPGTPLRPADRVVKVQRVCHSTGTAADVTTYGDGSMTAVGEYPCRWRGANR